MIRLVSLNTNKRVNTDAARTRLMTWLRGRGPTVFLAQEPWSKPGAHADCLGGLQAVGGSDRVFAWYDPQWARPSHEVIEPYLLRIELGYLVVYGVYLDAYDQAERARQLHRLLTAASREGDRPLICVGDFNIAPTPADGIHGAKSSDFNSKIDRSPLEELAQTLQLTDLGSSCSTWTVERTYKGQSIKFRCDLALASRCISHELHFLSDSIPRTGKQAFTDHSALVIEAPVTLDRTPIQADLFTPPSEQREAPPSTHPAKTAIARRGPSPVAKTIVSDLLVSTKAQSVLDFGCGRGEDVLYYRTRALRSEGYDPHEAFGWARKPEGTYDIVTLTFVLNVLSDPWQRVQVLREAARHLSSTGILVVTTRSPEEIAEQAQRGEWQRFNDGFWSHEGKGTFQRGISKEEILALGARVGLARSSFDRLLAPPSRACCAVLSRISSNERSG